jgi:hypothetical protein
MKRGVPPPYALVGVHRLPPPSLLGGQQTRRVRAALLGGALFELAKGEVHRVLDAASEAAGLTSRVTSFATGSGGSIIARARGPDGHATIFRAAPADGPGDPHRAAAALDTLANQQSSLVPKPLGRGRVGMAAWSLESLLPGRAPTRVDSALGSDLVRFCLELPRTDAPPTAWIQDLDHIASRFPRWAETLESLAKRLRGPLSSLPGVLRHGDLWARNLLVESGHLSGVLDWDAWHSGGVPGSDLTYLFVSEMWRATDRRLGELWVERPWRSPSFLDLTAHYWRAMGVTPAPATLDAIGVAAWAAQVSGNLRRVPHLIANRKWVSNNVDHVIGSIGRQFGC